MREQGPPSPAGPTGGPRLGPLMRRDRATRKPRQADVADALHVERSNVSQFETGARIPGPDLFRRWLAIYGPNLHVEAADRAAVEERALQAGRRRARRDAARSIPPERPGDARDAAAQDAIARALADADLIALALLYLGDVARRRLRRAGHGGDRGLAELRDALAAT